MTIFEYHTFFCDQDELQDRLTACGLECWRLHTCEPIAIIGPQGSGTLQILVVMDRVPEAPPAPEEDLITEPDSVPAMRMNDFRPDGG